jgi:hypothetical protein
MMYRICHAEIFVWTIELKSHTNYLGILTKPIAS